MSPLEIAAAVFSALSVLFTVRRSLWLWPTGLIGTALYFVVFLQARLYGSAGLQVFFLVIQLYGWWWWARGKAGEEPPIARLPRRAVLLTALAAVAAAGIAAWGLTAFTDARAAPADMLITTLSIAAQWLLSRKILENWLFWIAVDVLAIGVYASQGLALTAGLYGLFLAMACWGLWEWRRSLRAGATA
ncbi:nicotinamide riboside transporter PnuC [Caulobacter sp. NIBR1757]|uniref:nicotinamide riboside transporter PnuC n=1 Tax=Caulobacter sp. NIBR1757 TaxID=3016000 RepID=UPI0022F0CEFB|nr:nicotinamide riboside transporter PnuC [Caulobacter sp. NIBR1757]WGM38001.1 Riboflavin/roseoflavin transporter RibM [Caulobacter sp. NIBR1757]